jgi:non-catalytic primase subunit PriX-like protein
MNTAKTNQDPVEQEKSVTEGLDFILSRLKEPIWPRRISTITTEKRQVKVGSKEEALARFKQANFIDCRINAYPYDDFEEDAALIRRKDTIVFIVIDLDLSAFRSRQALNRALGKTMRNIEETFEAECEGSIVRIWSGNGYHIYIPVDSENLVLEDIPEFKKIGEEEPSKQCLRYAEYHLSNRKCDPAHNSTVSFGNCMLRIPGSHNSKCVARNNGVADSTTQVKIISGMDDGSHHQQKPKLRLMLGDFYAYLVDQRLARNSLNASHNNHGHHYQHRYHRYNGNHYYTYIERLLQTPIKDSRKRSISLVIIPYLVVIKRLQSDHEVFCDARGWLDRCSQVEALDRGYNYDYRIRSSIANSRKNQIPPMGLNKLKEENRQLYDTLVS